MHDKLAFAVFFAMQLLTMRQYVGCAASVARNASTLLGA
jgi:hypothetical protein